MGIFNFFRNRKPQASANIAKERLQVVIAHERSDREGPDYLPMLKQDILEVIKKYVSIGEDQVSVQLDSQDDCDVLELNITLPEDEVPAGKHPAKASKKPQPRKKSKKQRDVVIGD